MLDLLGFWAGVTIFSLPSVMVLYAILATLWWHFGTSIMGKYSFRDSKGGGFFYNSTWSTNYRGDSSGDVKLLGGLITTTPVPMWWSIGVFGTFGAVQLINVFDIGTPLILLGIGFAEGVSEPLGYIAVFVVGYMSVISLGRKIYKLMTIVEHITKSSDESSE